MSTLTSRPVQIDTDVRKIIEGTGAKIAIIDNTVVDPQMFSLTLNQNGKETPLMLKAGTHQITLFDLMNVLDQLGFHVDYYEVR